MWKCPLASQIRRACAYNLGEVIIFARDGSSLEDLMCFNGEKVVCAIAESSLRFISGVGHETDVTLADLVANVRVSKPSTAAELVSDRSEYLFIKTQGFREQFFPELRPRLETCCLNLQRYASRPMGDLIQSRIRESDYGGFP